MKNEFPNIEKRKYKLTFMSNVFIGSGENNDLDAFNKIVSIKGNIFVICEELLFRYLRSDAMPKGSLEKFIAAVSSQRQFSLQEFIKESIPKERQAEFLRAASIYTVETNGYSVEELKRVAKIKPFIKNSENKPYIPASSIKGAIRTAVEAEILRGKIIKNGNADSFFKDLIISDSTEFKASDLCVYKRDDVNLIEGKIKTDSRQKIYCEYAKKGTAIEFTVMQNKVKSVNNSSLDMLSAILKNHYSEHLLSEMQALLSQAQYKGQQDEKLGAIKIYATQSGTDTKPNIVIGGMSGFESKVILKAKCGDNQKSYEIKKKERLAKQFGRHSHDSMDYAPRYIKTAGGFMSGWCILEEIRG